MQTTRPHNQPIICSHPPVKTGRLTVWNHSEHRKSFIYFFFSHLSPIITSSSRLLVHYGPLLPYWSLHQPWYSLGTLWRRYSCQNNNCLHLSVPRRLEQFLWSERYPGAESEPSPAICCSCTLHSSVCVPPSEWLCAKGDLMPGTFQTHNNLCVAAPVVLIRWRSCTEPMSAIDFGCCEKYNVWACVSSKPCWRFQQTVAAQTLRAA